MKYLFTLTLLLGCACLGAKAQTVASNPAELFKQKPLATMDSLVWHMPKTPNFLNQMPLNKLTGIMLGNTIQPDALANAALVYSAMPVKVLKSNDKMPVAGLGAVGDRMIKKVVVVNPLAEIPKP